MDALLLHFDAPLMSFGGPAVDAYRVTQPYPALSMLTGLLGNALGYTHAEPERLQALQARIRYAVRCDRPGEPVQDYQTVDFGQDLFQGTGWTTLGRVEERAGGPESKSGTHIRYRDFLAGARYTVALTLVPAGEAPNLTDLKRALASPARPLFLGRKSCIPARPILAGEVTGESLYRLVCDAEEMKDSPPSPIPPGRRSIWFPAEETGAGDIRELFVSDARDWANQIHVGQRVLKHGILNPGGTP